jgi:uncharacterized membrane protein YfcA
VFSFFCEFIDTALGAGFGVVLVPILLLLGVSPYEALPAVLLSELVTGFLGFGFNAFFGNVSVSRKSPDMRAALLLSACGIAGALLALVPLGLFASDYLQLLLGILITLMGLAVFACGKLCHRFSLPGVAASGVVAAYCKTASGMGFGSIVTSGQMLSGVGPKAAVSVTSLAEGFSCLAGLAVVLAASGFAIEPGVALPVAIGGMLATPFAAMQVKLVKADRLRIAVALMNVFFGLLIVLREAAQLWT